MRTKLNSLIVITLLWCIQGFAIAQVSLPNGYYHTTTEDLNVKVLGGHVKASRTWANGKWHHTRAWNRLELEINSLDGSVKLATRNSNSYSGGGTSGSYTSSIHLKETIEKVDTGYRWFDKQGNWIDYDSDGDIVKYGDKNNVEVSFIYNASKKRVGVKDHFGVQRLWYEYNADGTVKSVRDHTDPAQAREVKYNYTNGLLTSVIDVLGSTWNYEYAVFIEGSDTQTILSSTGGTGGTYTSSINLQNAKAHLRKITDPEGRITNIDYLPSGRAKSVTKIDGTGLFYKYDFNKTKKEYYVQRTYSSGRVKETWYNNEGDILRQDLNGKTVDAVVISGRDHVHTDEYGRQNTITYDEFDNVTKIINADKTSRTINYDTKYSTVRDFTNELGVKSQSDYDALGNLKTITEAVATPEQRVTSLTYDTYGNALEVKRIADAITDEAKTTFTYDTDGNIGTITTAVSATENHVTQILSYDKMGNALQWKDPRGKIWNAEFDARGQFTKLTTPINQVYLFGYDKAGYPKTYTDPKLNTEIREIDINGRLKTITDLTGGIMTWNYDAKGNLAEKIDPENKKVKSVFAADGKVSQIIDGNLNVMQLTFGEAASKALEHQISQIQYPTFKREYKYNDRAQVNQVIDYLSTSEQHVSQIFYDAIGRVDYVIDAELNKKKFTYDALNRPSSVIDAKNQSSKFGYDNRDNLITVTNEADIIIRKFEYDRKDRKTKEIWPLGETFTSSYDANDNLIKKVDGKGQVTKLFYDDVNRLYKTEHYLNQSATAPVKTVDYAYNDLDQLTGYSDGTTSAIYSYDAMYRKLTESVNYGTFSKGFSFAYYKNGLKKTFTDSETVSYDYAYDANNQLQSINITGLGQITYNKYNWFAPEKITYPGGITRNISYDPLMRTKQILAQDSAKNSVMDYQYNYDKVGNVTSKTTEYGTHTYGYDELYRLTSATNPGQANESYTYDNAGNRKTSVGVTGDWVYNTNNQLKNYASNAFAYDNNGATTNKTEGGVSTDYVLNLENRLSEIKQGATSIASYYYDPFGRRLSKTVGGSTEYFSYTDEGLNSEYAQTGAIKQSYGFMPNSVWSTKPLYTKTSQGYSLYQNDALHTPQKMTNTQGKVVWGAQYNSFGKATVNTNDVSNNLRFPGQYSDSESGLNNNYFRYYNNQTGRYMRSDPYGIYAGMNSYVYAGQNPLMFYDPLGLLTWNDPATWPTFDQSTVDFAAGFGDTISFGATSYARDGINNAFDLQDTVDKCSGAYSAGEWTGIGFGFAAGGAAGWRAAGQKASGKELSHWIPNRMGGPKNLWNGNYVSTRTHALSDPYRYRFMKRNWKDANPIWSAPRRQFTRVPNWIKGSVIGGGAASGSAAINGSDCDCNN